MITSNTSSGWLAHLGFLTIFLLLAVTSDWRARKIPNSIVIIGTIVALISQTLLDGFLGFTASLKGFGIGFLLFLPLYLFRMMGAGDVKLMGMVGAFIGVGQIIGAVLGTLLAGFVFSIIYSLYKHALRNLLINVKAITIRGIIKLTSGKSPTFEKPAFESIGNMPYAIAIATGTLGYMSLSHLAMLFSK